MYYISLRPPAELVPDLLLAVGVAEVHVADHQHPVRHHHHRDDPAVNAVFIVYFLTDDPPYLLSTVTR